MRLVGHASLGSSRFRANDKHGCRKASNPFHGSRFIQPNSSPKTAAGASTTGKGFINRDVCDNEYVSLRFGIRYLPSLLTEKSSFISTSG